MKFLVFMVKEAYKIFVFVFLVLVTVKLWTLVLDQLIALSILVEESDWEVKFVLDSGYMMRKYELPFFGNLRGYIKNCIMYPARFCDDVVDYGTELV